MNIVDINLLSGSVMLPLVNALSKNMTVNEIENLYNTLVSMWKDNLMNETFNMLHTIIKMSGINLPIEYPYILDKTSLKADFVEESLADLDEIIDDLKN